MIPEWLIWCMLPVGLVIGTIIIAAARNTFR
jgi:hypothetical protein